MFKNIWNIPQVSAAIITATCGIFGIFINIIINISFRNQDYKNKNKIKQIENIECYYTPLYDMIEHIIKILTDINKDDYLKVYTILSDEIGAEDAFKIEAFKASIETLYNYFNNTPFKILDDYKIFKTHRNVKYMIYNLYEYIHGETESKDELLIVNFINELKKLNYYIKIYEANILIENPLLRVLELCKTLKNKN